MAMCKKSANFWKMQRYQFVQSVGAVGRTSDAMGYDLATGPAVTSCA